MPTSGCCAIWWHTDMAVAWLDLHDSNLQLWHGDLHLSSPGYALLEAGQYCFGQDARAAARLRPRDISTRYWWQLNTAALQPALGPARHTADLVHAHLQALHRDAGAPDELLLAAPGSMRKEQVALLLGIIQQCPFAAVGLVNRSVALASLHADQERVFHLEVQLHQALLSEVRREGTEVTLQKVTALPGSGLLALQERVVEAAAGAFIRQTRFDPRRRAETEQQLYDALPGTLRALHEASETSLSVNGYHARLTRGDLQAAGNMLLDSVVGNLPDASTHGVLLDPVAALLPDVATRLRARVLQPGDMQRALALHEPQLLQRAEALVFVERLPAVAQDVDHNPPRDVAEEQSIVATHLLCNAEARALTPDGTPLGAGWSLVVAADGGWRLRAGAGAGALARNTTPCRDGEPVANGDRLQLADGTEAQLIRVSD